VLMNCCDYSENASHYFRSTDNITLSVCNKLRTKGDVRRTTKSADFICRQNRPTKICRVSCKNRRILSADKIAGFCRPRQSMFYLRQFCRPTFRISDNKFCSCCRGDCLQQKMNIYFSYLLCLLLFSFIRCRKKVTQVLFCDLHSAGVLADNI